PHHSSCDTSVSSLVVQRPPSSPLFPYTTLFRSWLTVPDVPILPPWARSAASLRANAVALGRLCAWHTRYHLLRTPKYAFRVAWLATKGLWRAVRGLWPALTAHDRTAAVKALRAQLKAK